ncbi:NADH dehydrogenase (quinone) subunit D [Lujinxingia vulgaris]|uniref:NADH-quinone oxidoreductase subunit D n=1 Tax=Lujinxingia vulgaris TaxID=2600176 RepID=A0A5C6XI48_9DELT|nr:NADH dehydrogenase (quinone) subunit D [Lujinxingia vulgaris]TXD38545.1 NADH dehydrogenase (quinone) subunit D [Lujinxingia vulgaris]
MAEDIYKPIDQDIHSEPMILQMGPSHPATHGTVRFTLTLEGEKVIKCETEVGYLHRGFEKECEEATWTQVFPYTDRLNYVSPLLNNFGYALAVEKLLGIEVPERCDWIRTIMGELSRLSDHLTCIGAGGLELGAMTAFLYAIEGRELVWDLIEQVTGARLTVSYGRIGGLKDDLTPDFAERWAYTRERLNEIHAITHKLLTRNRIFLDRMEGTGVITPEMGVSYGYTGVCLRSTGVAYDVRKDHPYFKYGEVDFDVPVGKHGDNMDRYLCRMEELVQSIRIIDQCLAKMKPGPINTDDPRVALPSKDKVYNTIEGMISHFKIIFEGVQVPAGEVYSYTEGGNGELGFYIVSNGTGKPWKIHVRSPSLIVMGGIHKLFEGGLLADIIPTFDTVNMIGGECDK